MNYTYWSKRITEVKVNNGRGKLSFFGLYAPEKGRVEENKNFYDPLQEILNETNKKDFILPFTDLNARIRNAEILNSVGGFGEPVTNANGLKLRDFDMHNNMQIMNSFYTQKYIYTHTYTWSPRNSKTVIDYFTANRKLSKLFLEVSLQRK